MAEDRVRHILMSKKLPKIMSFLEKDGSVECILLLYMNKGRWSKAKEFLESINRTPLSDGTFRSRMLELVDLKISFRAEIDLLRSRYEISESGQIIADLILEYFEKLEPYF